LVDSGGLSLKLLSEKVSLAHSTVSGIVDRLEKRGMVKPGVLASHRRGDTNQSIRRGPPLPANPYA